MIGTELLLGETIDTNAAYIAQRFAELGIDVYYKSTVGDNWLRMIEVLAQALSRSDLVITSGGLGPTMDDQTRECIAAVVNRELVINQNALAGIEDYFKQINRAMPDNNKKQAMLPDGAKQIANSWGTAPGILLELGNNKVIIALPGVPRELKGMFNESVIPYLEKHTQRKKLVSRNLRFVGIGESQVEDLISDLVTNQTNPTIAPYASFGEVKLRLTAKAETKAAAQELIKPVEQEIRGILGQWLYGVDDQNLEMVIGDKLMQTSATLAVAESCTGGLIANRITNVPGSSCYFDRGFITYSNQAKEELLGVDTQLLSSYGAVSAQVAKAMANGARTRARTDWALAVTGIAGPGGGTATKPVGLVYISLAGKEHNKVEMHRFKGAREQIKYSVSQAALDLLRRALEEK